MPGEDLFKRYLEIGASMLGMSRERAEGIVKDLVASGEVARGQASKAADWLVERGRAGADELSELVRREVRQQVAALGLATKEDLDRLEARLTAAAPAAPTPAAPTPAAPTQAASVPKKAAARPKKAAAAAAPAKAAAGPAKAATTATKPPGGTKRAPGAKKAAVPASNAGNGEGAGITRSASVRRRPGRSGSPGPDAAPPAGGAVSPKG